ncbi:MAG: hypothetical protein RIC94_08000 [Phycisphaerales bacterium]|jgi:hypothetical protein
MDWGSLGDLGPLKNVPHTSGQQAGSNGRAPRSSAWTPPMVVFMGKPGNQQQVQTGGQSSGQAA